MLVCCCCCCYYCCLLSRFSAFVVVVVVVVTVQIISTQIFLACIDCPFGQHNCRSFFSRMWVWKPLTHSPLVWHLVLVACLVWFDLIWFHSSNSLKSKSAKSVCFLIVARCFFKPPSPPPTANDTFEYCSRICQTLPTQLKLPKNCHCRHQHW